MALFLRKAPDVSWPSELFLCKDLGSDDGMFLQGSIPVKPIGENQKTSSTNGSIPLFLPWKMERTKTCLFLPGGLDSWFYSFALLVFLSLLDPRNVY